MFIYVLCVMFYVLTCHDQCDLTLLFNVRCSTFDQAVSGVELVDPSVETDVLLSSGVTHMEEDPMNMLSLIASLTPFSDFNQSPRNMYQCQMGKQTMGTPAMALAHRTDNKMYRLQTPMAPIVQNRNQAAYKMDEYPNGTNAIVAVITYTGYDMEDAMIINKSSMERGFAHATVYKTKTIDLQNNKGGCPTDVFNNERKKGRKEMDREAAAAAEAAEAAAAAEGSGGEEDSTEEDEFDAFASGGGAGAASGDPSQEKYVRVEAGLDRDGLPHVGYRVSKDMPLYVTKDEVTHKHMVHKVSVITVHLSVITVHCFRPVVLCNERID